MNVELNPVIETIERKHPQLVGMPSEVAKRLARVQKISLEEAETAVEAFNEVRTQSLLALGAPELVRILTDSNHQRAQSTGLIRTCGALVILICLASAAFSWSRGQQFDFVPMICLLTIATGGIAAGATGNHKLTAQAAARLQDPRFLGPLLELLDSGDADLISTVKESVYGLLRAISAEDDVKLTELQQNALHHLLALESDADRAGVLITSLAKVGNLSTLNVLENAANGATPPVIAKQPRLQTAARMALGDLKLRLAGNEIRRTVEEADFPSQQIKPQQ